MGLDITVYKVKHFDDKESDDFITLNGDFNDVDKVVECFAEKFGNDVIYNRTIPYYDFEKMGFNENSGYMCMCESYSKDGCAFIFAKKDDDGNWTEDEKTIKFTHNESEKYITDVVKRVVYVEEVGYQRKGMTSRFYEEYTDDDYLVFEKSRLDYLYNNCVKEDCKEDFKNNILDTFVEGETVCTFSW